MSKLFGTNKRLDQILTWFSWMYIQNAYICKKNLCREVMVFKIPMEIQVFYSATVLKFML